MKPYVAKCDADPDIRVPTAIGKTVKGWTLTCKVFVDSSGYGLPGEPALTKDEFIASVKKGLGYAVTDIGQFQVYVGVYERNKKEKA